MKIYIGTDHAGFELKEVLKKYLPELGLGYEVTDMGAFTLNTEDDYPDFITPVAKAVAEGPELEERRGIIIGGSGNGEAMCANRVPGVRAAVFYGQEDNAVSPDTFEIVKLAREHNNANIISIGARFVDTDEAKFAVELFLKTEFSKDERHIRRLSKF
ncbi:MAG TPA: RpiB/LacA/LacB family sugar-phosphate isomerase [Candidatus Paceibacterota bacterium]